MKVELQKQIIQEWEEIKSFVKKKSFIKPQKWFNEIDALLKLSVSNKFSEVEKELMLKVLQFEKDGILAQDKETSIKRSFNFLFLKLLLIGFYFGDLAKKKINITDRFLNLFFPIEDKGKTSLLDRTNEIFTSIESKKQNVEDTIHVLETKNQQAKEVMNDLISTRDNTKDQGQKYLDYFSESNGRVESAISKSEQFIQEAEQARQEIQDLLSKVQAVQKEAEATLAHSNQAGMAGAFSKKASSCLWPMAIYLFLMAGAVTTIVWLGYNLIDFSQENQQINWQITLLIRTIIISPCIFVIWFSAGRFREASYLREKYAFKYTTAMAFEGYKKQIKDLDLDSEANPEEKQKLLDKLLEISIDIFSDDPTKINEDKEFLLKKKELVSLLNKNRQS